ncbi:MAG: hypothetical protein WC570_02145 [Patescibacteria group bacterium]
MEEKAIEDKVEPKKLIGLDELISGSFKRFGEKFITFIRLELFKIGIFLASILVLAVVALIISALAGSNIVDIGSGDKDVATWIFVIFMIFVFMVLIWLFVFAIWSEAAYAEIATFYEEKFGVIEAFKRSWPKLSTYFWTVVAKELTVLGGLILFIVPGVIVAIWFSFVEFIVMRREASGVAALMLSKKYVRGNWWEVFGRVAIMVLIVIGIAMGFSLVEEAANLVVTIISSFINNDNVTVVANIIIIIVSVIISLCINAFNKGWKLIYRSYLFNDFQNLKGVIRDTTDENPQWLYIAWIIFILIIIGAIVLSGSILWLASR